MSGKEKRARHALALITSGRWFTVGDIARRLGTPVQRTKHIFGPYVAAGRLEAGGLGPGHVVMYRWRA